MSQDVCLNVVILQLLEEIDVEQMNELENLKVLKQYLERLVNKTTSEDQHQI
jgi:hypothetical protein